MSAPKIRFFYEGTRPGIRDRTRLKKFLEKLIGKEGGKLKTLNYVFCTDKNLLRINQEYLGHNDLTDIITFNLSPDPRHIEGEVYISVDRVKENSTIYKVPFSTELRRVMFHGALHLCGYQDKSVKDKQLMRAAEDLWLSLY